MVLGGLRLIKIVCKGIEVLLFVKCVLAKMDKLFYG